MRQVSLRCDQYEASTPYYPFRPFLRSLLNVELNGGGQAQPSPCSRARLEEVDEELVPWTPLLAAPLDVEVETTPEVDDLDPAFWRARLHGVMGTLLGQLLDSPTLLVFDDVHWMDDASSELLRYLGTQLPTKPWLTCTTRRPIEGGFTAAEGTPPLPALTLRLEPLPAEDARTLAVAAAGDRRLTEEELAALMERGAGNPLFLRELASVGEKTDEAEELPETVEALVATRIDQLGPGDRALLRWASVLGVSFSASLIADVLEDDPLGRRWLGGVGSARRVRRARPRRPWRVPLPSRADPRRGVRRTFVQAAPRAPRPCRRGHRAASRRPARGRGRAAVAPLLRAGRWPEAWRYSRRRGDGARRRSTRTSRPRSSSSGRSRRSGASADVAAGRGRARLGGSRRRADATRAVRASAGLHIASRGRVPRRRRRAGAAHRRRRRWLRSASARYPQALRRLTQALRILEESKGGRRRATSSGSIGCVRHRPPVPAAPTRRDRMVRAHDRGSGATGDARTRSHTPTSSSTGRTLQLGRLDEAVYSARAIEIYEELGDLDRLAWVLNNLGGLTYLEGRWDEALELAERARGDLQEDRRRESGVYRRTATSPRSAPTRAGWTRRSPFSARCWRCAGLPAIP